MPIIEARGLVKEFRRPKQFSGPFGLMRTLVTQQYTVTRAVDQVGFDVEPGELIGYLGPNGAGKSTMIKMLTGILVPTAGTVRVDGIVPWRERTRNARQIGVVFGQRSGLIWDLPLKDSLWLVARLYEVSDQRYREAVAQFTELLELTEFLDTPVRQLSLGQRMRGDLVAAMLYRPKVLYLDEPTVGLDVVAKDRIRRFVAEMNAQSGTTVVLSTHDLEDVEQLCGRILLIDHGRVVYDGDVATLKTKYAPHRELTLRLSEAAPEVSVPGAEVVRRSDARVCLRYDPATTPTVELVSRVLEAYPVADLSIVEPDLTDVIRQIYDSPAGPDT